MVNSGMRYTPNLKKIELCLTYRCNVKCANCSNLCTQAPAGKDADLSTADIERFIEQSIGCGRKWGLITLHGGEPVLNPAIHQICEMLRKYRELHSANTRISLLSNGSTPAILRQVHQLCSEFGFEPGISEKVKSNHRGDGTPIPYVPVNISPEDKGNSYTIGCFQTTDCGICLNYAGYWPCSPMAAAARVFGYQPMAKTVAELTEDVLAKGFELHCKHCGFAGSAPRVIGQASSKTWIEAFARYSKG